jgi:hypothetical protein
MIGVLLVVVSLLLLANPRAVWGEWVQVVLGVLQFLSPWVLGYQALSPANWFAWVIGVLAVIAAGSVLLGWPGEPRPQGTRPA